MPRKPYRVELIYRKSGPTYYLVKDVKVGTTKRKIRKYLGKKQPTMEEKIQYSIDFSFEMELKAIQLRAKLESKLYKSTNLNQEQIENIETIKHLYHKFNELLTTSEVDVYEENFEVNYVKGTTSIEGNTLNLKETYDLLIKGIAPKGKELREINEVQNFKNVRKYRDSYKRKITIGFIKKLHAFIMDNIDTESAGKFRRVDDIGIVGCDISVTPSILINEELGRIIAEYYENISNKNISPFEAAILFHYYFEIIHPFTDGNGRVGREILNFMLMRSGYPKMLFLGESREKYIEALRYGNSEDYSKMIEIFYDIITEQRLNLLMKNFAKVIVEPPVIGQLRLTDFFEIK